MLGAVGEGWAQSQVRYLSYAFLYVVFAVDAVYLRYSPDGTAWDYLRHAEEVELVCHGPRGFDAVHFR